MGYPEKISPETIGNSGSGGSGGDGGWIQFVNEGNLDGSMTIDVSGGSGGGGGMFAATGTAGSGGAGGLGGLGQVWANDLTESITITSNGGAGGTGGEGGAFSYIGKDDDGNEVWDFVPVSDGGAGGTGGDAGVANIILSGDMKADATLTSTGGNGGDGGETGNGGVGGAGGKGGSVLVFAKDIGTIDTAETPGPIGDTIDLTVDVSSGDGGTGGGGWFSHDKYGGDGGSSTLCPGGTRTTYSDIRMQFTGDVLSDARITAKAIGGDGGDAGKPGTYEAAKGADGGDGGHIYMWADDIAKDAEVTLDISGGAGGNGGTGGNGGNAPTETIYVSADTISGTVDATAAGGALGGGGGSTAGTGGRVYVDGTITGGGAVNIHGASTTTPPAVIPSPPIAPTAPTAFNSVQRFSFTPPDSNLSPAERIAATILQLQNMGFVINPDDGLVVTVKDIPYYIIPAIDPNNKDVWLIFDENGNLVGHLDALENLENVLDPDIQAMVEKLGNFVREIKAVDPQTVHKQVEEALAMVQTADSQVVAAASVMGVTPPVLHFIQNVIAAPSDYDVVAGWPCPADYTPEQKAVQLKEDYMKNYLVVMESMLSEGFDPTTLDTDTGLGQQVAWMVTLIKLMQNGEAALSGNYELLTTHSDDTPWSYNEMLVYKDNEAASVTLESDASALSSIGSSSAVICSSGAEPLQICSDVNPVTTLRLISNGIFTDDALRIASAGFDTSISSFGLGGFVDARCRAA
ncbi:MAG: hypothetical protein JXA44_04970 [Methanospirillaceae archaeon]|nr:hypothetical protein [Methanospirillaceae archaeon]